METEILLENRELFEKCPGCWEITDNHPEGIKGGLASTLATGSG